jgi:coenzyme PQQ synthesis protein D (PqqD)
VSVYRVPDGVLQASLEDGLVLLNERTGQYHHLNATGVRIVSLLEGGASLDAIVDAIGSETGEPVARVGADVSAFVSALAERGLLEPVADVPR